MTYVAPGTTGFAARGGSLAKKITSELALIDTELDSLVATDAAGLKIVKGTLTAGAANAFALAWQNPESSKILVTRVMLRIETAGGTATSVIDVGPGASATTHSDTLIDGLDINQTGIFDNITNKGSNGLAIGCVLDEKDGTTDYITGQILTEAASALVGKYYIFYTVV